VYSQSRQQPPRQPQQQTVQTYRGHSAFVTAIVHMQERGWRVATVASEQRGGPGCLRVVLPGPLAFLGRRRATYTVTFTR
jgi:hypothetical protein